MTPPVNVAAHLARRAAASPTQVAVHDGKRHVTFAQLSATTDALTHGFAAVGVARGDRVAVMVPPSVEFFAVTFALLQLGATPVMIDPGMGLRNLAKCLAHAEPAAFVGVAKAHAARRFFGWAKPSLKLTVNVGNWSFGCHHSTRSLVDAGRSRGPWALPEFAPTDAAAVLFTSGSTGVAKGVNYPHGVFAAQVEALRDLYGIEPGEVDLCTFPLFALFGPALGMTCVVPRMDPTSPATIDPEKVFAQMRQYRVTNLFGSPAVVDRLGQHPGGEDALSTLRRVVSAGAPARLRALEALQAKLPVGVEISTPYGATECLPVSNVGTREILGETAALTRQGKGVCVGRPHRSLRVEVIAISDAAVPTWSDLLTLPAGVVGEFVVRGPVVTREYFRNPAATALAKIPDPATGEVLHRMGDVGYLDEAGRLWFCGRKSHRVETPTGTLFTDMVEPVFNEFLGDCSTALVGVKRGGVTHPVLCFHFYTSGMTFGGTPVTIRCPEFVEELAALGAKHAHTAGIVTFLAIWCFPVDVRHNSKINRELLAVWADKMLGPTWNGGPA